MNRVQFVVMNSSIVVERLENRDEQLKQQIVSALTHFLPIQNLVTCEYKDTGEKEWCYPGLQTELLELFAIS